MAYNPDDPRDLFRSLSLRNVESCILNGEFEGHTLEQAKFWVEQERQRHAAFWAMAGVAACLLGIFVTIGLYFCQFHGNIDGAQPYDLSHKIEWQDLNPKHNP